MARLSKSRRQDVQMRKFVFNLGITSLFQIIYERFQATASKLRKFFNSWFSIELKLCTVFQFHLNRHFSISNFYLEPRLTFQKGVCENGSKIFKNMHSKNGLFDCYEFFSKVRWLNDDLDEIEKLCKVSDIFEMVAQDRLTWLRGIPPYKCLFRCPSKGTPPVSCPKVFSTYRLSFSPCFWGKPTVSKAGIKG